MKLSINAMCLKFVQVVKLFCFFVWFFGRKRPRFFGASGKFPAHVRENCRCPTPRNKKAPKSLASGACLFVFAFPARSFLLGSRFAALLGLKMNLKHRKWTWIFFRVSRVLPGNFLHFLRNLRDWSELSGKCAVLHGLWPYAPQINIMYSLHW